MFEKRPFFILKISRLDIIRKIRRGFYNPQMKWQMKVVHPNMEDVGSAKSKKLALLSDYTKAQIVQLTLRSFSRGQRPVSRSHIFSTEEQCLKQLPGIWIFTRLLTRILRFQSSASQLLNLI